MLENHDFQKKFFEYVLAFNYHFDFLHIHFFCLKIY